MAQDGVILQFTFPTFGDSMLQKMDALRRDRRFCDVIVRINHLEVPGHKVVFAAGSPFLRDQFFLQDSHEVQISTQQDADVGQRLLHSCYTGTLEFPELELVHYLTVASFLQMGHIVEQCTEALNKFIKPNEVKDERASSRQPSAFNAQHAQPVVETLCDEEDEVNNDGEDDFEEDDDIIIESKSPPMFRNSQNRSREDSPISIVKVESIDNRLQDIPDNFQNCSTRSPTLRSPEPQHSLINSTVETRSSGISANPAAEYSLSSPGPSGSGKGNLWGCSRNVDKGMQWYHQCPKCARVFRQLENYANHLKMHKLFMCLLCGKTFTQKGNLHRHMRVHAGIKPFQCKICGKTFTQKCSLLDHLNLHSGDKPHRCNYCDMVFAHKPVLRKHLKQIHGKNSFDNANEGSLLEGL
ncbi:zinc finger and BTB domain-containing protein 26-like [Myxocyprinus asiaticus]|uniref:zinc finger and BTB domain-containing protein 26-like n=1 Tax=Myxocyprinus asiaticus TaxID=70543 RepID=UPI0022227B55|nr:zinc finger and BTB domain-containing protein 26-like [Myxocyprinus asiaticus]XP_051551223.1 zinc finger and BTB domain-containing protein 26-like [Myxocyprinus asiaticus]XP_051551230.1 zinc finger and BTB domain-containing protein 26-like [Myxocyprinus asiaticus]XP_051551239.1 zinc finger and BTB domain-containing protein 26-like [Myxocyprinus asiaticus]XP_051551247.1 zinc finger and BTB domain-containing protein 26-like [Myxocyprinus asiaticus]XP_051551255.1 zinc finger and BTB domain-con